MSLLSRYLTDAHRAELSKRVTPSGFQLADVIRSGLRHPESSVGVYAPDFQSYDVFRELFEPILENFQAPSLAHRTDLACLNPVNVVSTRIRMARNLAGHLFPGGMSRSERLTVEAKIAHACRSLAPEFEGTVMLLKDIPGHRLHDMISKSLAFGPEDKYMAAAGIHADWPMGRSVFVSHTQQLSVWINEEDHLRVALVMPGACVSACHEAMAWVMSRLAFQLDFCTDAQRGYLTSCPSNVGAAMRASYRVNLHLDASQKPLLERLESAGILQIRSASGEHTPRADGLVDISFRNRVGALEAHMQRDLEGLLISA